jgi:hypothetical protein
MHPSGGRKMSKPEDDAGLRLWTERGVEAVYFQREAQVNFWTVMGGIAVAALLTQFSAAVSEIQAGHWQVILWFGSSLLIIINSWAQASWGSLILRWPITVPITFYFFMYLFGLDVQCLLVTNPPGWLAATAVILFFALLNQLYFEKTGAWRAFSPETIKRFKGQNRFYFATILLCLAGAAGLSRYPSALAESICGVVVLAGCILALVIEHKGMQGERDELKIP